MAYILASSNSEKYVPFKNDIYANFLSVFDLGEKEKDRGVRYSNYIKYCQLIKDKIKEFRLIENPTILDGQDFIYCIFKYKDVIFGNMQMKDVSVTSSEISQPLASKKQIILYGPPGTGKTWKTKEFAAEFLENNNKIQKEVKK